MLSQIILVQNDGERRRQRQDDEMKREKEKLRRKKKKEKKEKKRGKRREKRRINERCRIAKYTAADGKRIAIWIEWCTITCALYLIMYLSGLQKYTKYT